MKFPSLDSRAKVLAFVSFLAVSVLWTTRVHTTGRRSAQPCNLGLTRWSEGQPLSICAKVYPSQRRPSIGSTDILGELVAHQMCTAPRVKTNTFRSLRALHERQKYVSVPQKKWSRGEELMQDTQHIWGAVRDTTADATVLLLLRERSLSRREGEVSV